MHRILRYSCIAFILMLLAAACASSDYESMTSFSLPEQYSERDAHFENARDELQRRLKRSENTRRAQNVIIFIADGMGPSLVTASRIYQGQLRGEEGEENYLTFEQLPNSALVKTYASDAQIPDSAATASAIMTGVKTRNSTISVYADATESDCAASVAVPETIGETAHRLGKSIGVVTTSYIVDATPAAVFGHAGDRSWVLPQYVPEEASAKGCEDLALQLVKSNVSVALGGGRTVFFPSTVIDPEQGAGSREDDKNLVNQWLQRDASTYVWNKDQLNELRLGSVSNLLGLFARAAIDSEESENSRNPSLAEMTKAAIQTLSNDDDGYILVVEHEGTDEHQHEGHIKKAMQSVHELDAAVAAALKLVDLKETLIIVTADHGQPLTFSGFAPKGHPILGLAENDGAVHLAEDGKPYTTLGFYMAPQNWEGSRPDLRNVDTTQPDFIPQSAVPSEAVYHSGSDVTLYSTGPWAHLFTGVIDQNTIYHMVMHAMTNSDV